MTRQTMRSGSGSAAVLVAALTLSACGSTEAEQAHDQLHLWKEREPASYVYVSNSYQLRSDSLFFDTDNYDYGLWRVVVENGNAVSVSDFPHGQPLSDRVTTLDGLMKRVIFYMEDAGYTPDDYEATYDDRWGYVKHFFAGVDDSTRLDIDCFMPSTGDDACPVSEVAKEDCAAAPVTVPIQSFAKSYGASDGCEPGQAFTKVQGESLMCCHSH
jgi:hypothetical protein